MARAAKKLDDDTDEVKVKDFDRAKELYYNDIKPAKSKAAEQMQEASTAYKAVKKECHIQPSAMKAAVKVIEMEDAKSEDWLRCFNGILRAHNIDPDPKDMVDMMHGDDGYARPRPTLVTVPESDGVDADLAGDEGGGFDEASDEELARQEGRGGVNEG